MTSSNAEYVQEKYSQTDVDYHDDSLSTRLNCGVCEFFNMGTSCEIVESPVLPSGICLKFEANAVELEEDKYKAIYKYAETSLAEVESDIFELTNNIVIESVQEAILNNYRKTKLSDQIEKNLNDLRYSDHEDVLKAFVWALDDLEDFLQEADKVDSFLWRQFRDAVKRKVMAMGGTWPKYKKD